MYLYKIVIQNKKISVLIMIAFNDVVDINRKIYFYFAIISS